MQKETDMAVTDLVISKRVETAGASSPTEKIAVEQPLEILVNGSPLITLMRSPGNDCELAVGLCLTENIVESVRSIKSIKQWGDQERRRAQGEEFQEPGLERSTIELEVEKPQGMERFTPTDVVKTGSGGAHLKLIAASGQIARSIESDVKVDPGTVYGLGQELSSRQDVARSTRGTHGAAIFSADGEMVVVREDIGRHNALDKVVGFAALHDIHLQDKLLAISGRISFEMALKAIRAGFPFLISLKVPTSLGIKFGEDAGLTIIGRVQRDSFNIYSHGWRVKS